MFSDRYLRDRRPFELRRLTSLSRNSENILDENVFVVYHPEQGLRVDSKDCRGIVRDKMKKQGVKLNSGYQQQDGGWTGGICGWVIQYAVIELSFCLCSQ